MTENSHDNSQDFQVNDKSSLHKYRTETPNIIEDLGLDPFAYRLYVHYKKVAGDNGRCFEKKSTISEKTGMSASVIKDRNKILSQPFDLLGGKPLIKLTQRKCEDGVNLPTIVEINDIWPDNFKILSTRFSDDPPPVFSIPPSVAKKLHKKNQRKKNLVKKDTYKEDPEKNPKSKVREKSTMSFSKDNQYVLEMAKKFNLDDTQIDTVTFLCGVEGLDTKPETVCWWARCYSLSRIQEVVRYAQSKGVTNIGAYINSLLKIGAVINEANILENTELAKFYRDEMKENIEITKKYVKLPQPSGSIDEIPLTLDVKTFSESMRSKLGDFI